MTSDTELLREARDALENLMRRLDHHFEVNNIDYWEEQDEARSLLAKLTTALAAPPPTGPTGVGEPQAADAELVEIIRAGIKKAYPEGSERQNLLAALYDLTPSIEARARPGMQGSDT